jgi:Co/Zn/Cd efflux system component
VIPLVAILNLTYFGVEFAVALAIIVAGLVTAVLWLSAWPDLIVGLGIAALNADAARAVLRAARAEHQTASGTS